MYSTCCTISSHQSNSGLRIVMLESALLNLITLLNIKSAINCFASTHPEVPVSTLQVQITIVKHHCVTDEINPAHDKVKRTSISSVNSDYITFKKCIELQLTVEQTRNDIIFIT